MPFLWHHIKHLPCFNWLLPPRSVYVSVPVVDVLMLNLGICYDLKEENNGGQVCKVCDTLKRCTSQTTYEMRNDSCGSNAFGKTPRFHPQPEKPGPAIQSEEEM